MVSEGELDISDDDDSYYRKKPRGGQRGKSIRNTKASKGHKSIPAPARKRKGLISDDEISADDSEADSDEDFRTRRSAHLRRNNNLARKNETRTSSRSIRKVSYAESEESEEIDEGKNKKSQKVCYAHIYPCKFAWLNK